ncbi:MAG: peptide ABC transporter substrate-binding protein [Pyrinomonadaceae bacterium]|nr:peptide ABC transporter substrate-binding protein [Pyrinomonadaceae bacterium]
MIADPDTTANLRPTTIRSRLTVAIFVIAAAMTAAGCGQLNRPKAETFYAQTKPPKQQEFRWSNGKAPKNLDPARAAAAPETDVVRGIYEGLTDLDAKSLKPIPGVAERWESSSDLKTWTFYLRRDARWSNGETVTANDFVRSWKRLAELREKAANNYLFGNIVGMARTPATVVNPGDPVDFLGNPVFDNVSPLQQMSSNSNSAPETKPEFKTDAKTAISDAATETAPRIEPVPLRFGVEAVDEHTLKVELVSPDKDLPGLVANPVFRPIYGDGTAFDRTGAEKSLVTNGPFRIAESGNDGLVLERAEHYWNRKAVGLERVRFVPMETAEKALEAYRAGSVDAITNANFEPLALKLLAPYEDFRRTTHSALNYYEFNTRSTPFRDRRVREALTIAIDRERLAEGELEGSVEPANKFLAISDNGKFEVAYDVEDARGHLAAAGYPNGEGFPKVRLVINRNNLQQRIARFVARMWKQNLNIDTDIIVKEPAEIEAARVSGDYDLMRRGVVLPAADELASLAAIFRTDQAILLEPAADTTADAGKRTKDPSASPSPSGPSAMTEPQPAPTASPAPQPGQMLSEEAAIFELRAIPLYFPKSYAMVKPYVSGFEMNSLDAPSLKEVSIDNDWQPRPATGE